ncbi:hypothetical protein C8F01DRAFT_1002506, partial [Mycena amicta]
DGTRWTRCGHFQRHFITAIQDCMSRNCAKSQMHSPSCRRTTCVRNFGPDVENDVDSVDDLCWACKSALDRAARGVVI